MQGIIDWILAHQIVLAVFIVALLDLAFALAPKLEANGILHQIYLWVKKLSEAKPVEPQK